MSADNYLLMKQTETGFAVYELSASGDYKEEDFGNKIHPTITAPTLEAAIIEADNWMKNNICEYGLQFDLDGKIERTLHIEIFTECTKSEANRLLSKYSSWLLEEEIVHIVNTTKI